ncbi:L-lactate permease, partial [Bacillus altitudinis]|uniref:L-lactate permease n=1 Tax=Bacillus altitudinis TaxID=293387 RepID=UPI001643DBFF
TYTPLQLLKPCSPFYILTPLITLSTLPPFKALFPQPPPLNSTTILLKIPFLHHQILKLPPIPQTQTPIHPIFKIHLISPTPTPILIPLMLTP